MGEEDVASETFPVVVREGWHEREDLIRKDRVKGGDGV